MIRRPRGVLFDMGGTLASDVRFDLDAGLKRVLQDCTLGSVDPLAQARTCWERQLQQRAKSLVECSFACYLRLALERQGVTARCEWEALEIPFWQAAVEMKPEPGVARCLEWLAHAGVPVGVVSNSIFASPTLEKELSRLELRKPFAFVLSSADYGIRKPDPWIFELAASRLGVPRQELWFIGDSLNYDVEGARAAGLTPLWYAPEGADPEPPVQRLRHWDELAPLVGAL